MPSEASLTQRFGIARETARRAVALLRAEGLIVTTRAVGSFVRLPAQCEPVTAGAGTTIRSRMPTADERRSLHIAEGIPVLVITHPDGRQELAPADRTAVVVVSEPAGSPMPPAEPTPAEPTPAELVPGEPLLAEPLLAEPVSAEPVSAEPASAEPTPAEPAPVKPA